MEKLVHIIAVVIGFILYMATKNIIISAVIAVAVEGMILAIIIVLSKVKSSNKQFAAWQAGIAKTPPLKKLWWRIAMIVVFGIIILVGFIPVIIIPNNTERPQDFGIWNLFLIIILCIPIVLSALSLKKAKKWNEAIQQAQSSGRSHVNDGKN